MVKKTKSAAAGKKKVIVKKTVSVTAAVRTSPLKKRPAVPANLPVVKEVVAPAAAKVVGVPVAKAAEMKSVAAPVSKPSAAVMAATSAPKISPAVKPAVLSAASVSAKPAAVQMANAVHAGPYFHPNTTPISYPVKKNNSVVKSPRAAFYLGLTFGILLMNLLLMIVYYGVVSYTYSVLSEPDQAQAKTVSVPIR